MLKNSLELLFENKLKNTNNCDIRSIDSSIFDLKVKENFKNIKNSFELNFVFNNMNNCIKHYKG